MTLNYKICDKIRFQKQYITYYVNYILSLLAQTIIMAYFFDLFET